MFLYDKIMMLAIVIGNLSAHCTDDKRSNKYNEKYTSATAVRLFEMLSQESVKEGRGILHQDNNSLSGIALQFASLQGEA